MTDESLERPDPLDNVTVTFRNSYQDLLSLTHGVWERQGWPGRSLKFGLYPNIAIMLAAAFYIVKARADGCCIDQTSQQGAYLLALYSAAVTVGARIRGRDVLLLATAVGHGQGCGSKPN